MIRETIINIFALMALCLVLYGMLSVPDNTPQLQSTGGYQP